MLILQITSLVTTSVRAAITEYERAVKARETPEIAKMTHAVLKAADAASLGAEAKAVLTPALRTKLADALAHVGYNIAAINARRSTL